MREEIRSLQEEQKEQHSAAPALKEDRPAAHVTAFEDTSPGSTGTATVNEIESEIDAISAEVEDLHGSRNDPSETKLAQASAADLRQMVMRDAALYQTVLERHSEKVAVQSVQETEETVVSSEGEKKAYVYTPYAQSVDKSASSIAPISDGDGGGSSPGLRFMHPAEEPVVLPSALGTSSMSSSTGSNVYKIYNEKKRQEKEQEEQRALPEDEEGDFSGQLIDRT